ncbi:hypothetical protein B0H14DRAFT_3691206 [Mycena olivaceomarginata]|nr:hypothetical protein B0H14DRAFT_3691206 [Mycena olivaceomarginata]
MSSIETVQFDLTALVNSTTTSWSVAGDLNATVSASEHASGGANARVQFIKFLNDIDAVDIWSNNPERSRHHNWTSRAGVGALSGNIIDRCNVKTTPAPGANAHAQFIKFLNDIDTVDIWSNNPERSRHHNWTSRAGVGALSGNIIDRCNVKTTDFVPSTNHRAVAACIQLSPPHRLGTTVFLAHKASLNVACIKFPTRAEKNQHEDFRIEIENRLEPTDLYDCDVTDDTSFTDIYKWFTEILIPASEKAYGRVACHSQRLDNLARLRFTSGAIHFINNPDDTTLSHGAYIVYLGLLDSYNAHTKEEPTVTLIQHTRLWRKALYRELFKTRATEIKQRKERYDRTRIANTLRRGSTKHLIHPGKFIELPITVNRLHSDQIASDPTEVKNITRQYWSELYAHELPPNVQKPWLTTKSVLEIKQCIHTDLFIWPRRASLSDFRALLRKGTPRPAPGRDQWEKWIIKNLPDRTLEIRGLLLSNFLANSPMSWLNFNLVPYIAHIRILPETQVATQEGVQTRDLISYLSGIKSWARRHKTTVYTLKQDQMKGFDYLSPQGMYDAVSVFGLPASVIDLDHAAQTNTTCYIWTAYGVTVLDVLRTYIRTHK